MTMAPSLWPSPPRGEGSAVPRSLMHGRSERFRQGVEEARARPRRGAEAGEVLGVHLTVHEVKLPGVELSNQMDEGDLGGVRTLREHGFAKERGAQRDAV